MTVPTPSTIPTKMLASGMREAEAIQGAMQGDGKCFEFLYCLYKRRVYSLCLRMTGNISRAEDLTQDAFIQLYRKIASFHGDSAFASWVQGLTFDIALAHLRERGLLRVSLDETLEPTEAIGLGKDCGFEQQSLASSIDRLMLERAIESLSPGRRIIFVLHDMEGYKHDAIAEMLGCSTGNCKSQLHKARMKLRGLLNASRSAMGHPTKMRIQPQVMMVRNAGVPLPYLPAPATKAKRQGSIPLPGLVNAKVVTHRSGYERIKSPYEPEA